MKITKKEKEVLEEAIREKKRTNDQDRRWASDQTKEKYIDKEYTIEKLEKKIEKIKPEDV